MSFHACKKPSSRHVVADITVSCIYTGEDHTTSTVEFHQLRVMGASFDELISHSGHLRKCGGAILDSIMDTMTDLQLLITTKSEAKVAGAI